MDIVLQGNLSEATKAVVNNCLKTSFVEKLIVSCWDTCDTSWIENPDIVVVKSRDVDNPGIGNRNRQIKSSLAGVRATTSPHVAKLRTDQIITVDSLEMMYRFFEKFKEPQLKYSDGSGPQTQLFVAGTFWPFPFHPRDHLFFGGREDLIRLFDIPHCPYAPTPDEQYNSFSRAECYIGTHYAKHFLPDIWRFLENPELYLTDAGVYRGEAMALSNDYRDKIFKVFPRIEFAWPKHNMPTYHYWHTQGIEYWHDTPWE